MNPEPVKSTLINERPIDLYEDGYVNLEEISEAIGRSYKALVNSWEGDLIKSKVNVKQNDGKYKPKKVYLVKLRDFCNWKATDKQEGYLYYIVMHEYNEFSDKVFTFIKIGKTKDLDGRLSTYNTGRHFKLSFNRTVRGEDCHMEERRLCDALSKYRLEGENYLYDTLPIIEERFDELSNRFHYM